MNKQEALAAALEQCREIEGRHLDKVGRSALLHEKMVNAMEAATSAREQEELEAALGSLAGACLYLMIDRIDPDHDPDWVPSPGLLLMSGMARLMSDGQGGWIDPEKGMGYESHPAVWERMTGQVNRWYCAQRWRDGSACGSIQTEYFGVPFGGVHHRHYDLPPDGA